MCEDEWEEGGHGDVSVRVRMSMNVGMGMSGRRAIMVMWV